MLWRRLILKNNGVITNILDVSSLSKVTDGYTPGHMLTAITQVLTERRITTLSKKPLQSVEFIAPLARIDPIYKEEEEAFKVLYVIVWLWDNWVLNLSLDSFCIFTNTSISSLFSVLIFYKIQNMYINLIQAEKIDFLALYILTDWWSL